MYEHTADERERKKGGNEKERNKEAERGERSKFVRTKDSRENDALLRRAEIQRQECRPSRMEKER